MALPLEELTHQIIGAAIEVHSRLGPGFIESIYENALVLELQVRGVPFERQLNTSIVYRGVEVGLHRLDLLAFNEIVVELKAVSRIKPIHLVTLRPYLRAADREHGLLLNFATTTLGIKRVTTRRDLSFTPS